MDILIVDDSAAIRKILRRVLQQAELPIGQVYEAGDGAEAIEALKAQKVNLIFSDINMPNMDGFALLKQVRADDNLKGIPFLMVTAEAKKEDIVNAAQNGANGYIVKPFTKATLEEKVQKIMQKAA